MKTLVASPFKDDAVEILEWAFGPHAKDLFFDYVSQNQRVGQAFMNVLYVFAPEEYNRLTGSLVDVFYDDTKLPAAIDRLTSK